jgi:hypothetical protein
MPTAWHKVRGIEVELAMILLTVIIVTIGHGHPRRRGHSGATGRDRAGGSMNCLVAETVYASFVHRRMAWDVAFAFANTGYAVAYVRGSCVPQPVVSRCSNGVHRCVAIPGRQALAN